MINIFDQVLFVSEQEELKKNSSVKLAHFSFAKASTDIRFLRPIVMNIMG